MSKKVSPGSEVDSYCTKCKLDLNHRIIAMDGDKIVRVECLTCRGHHNYRIPKSAKPKPKPRAKRAPSATATRAAIAKAAQLLHEQWESAIMGTSTTDFTVYKISEMFELGQLVRHKKFGDGVVAELIEGGKVQVLFEQGPKLLVHMRT